MSNRTYTSNLVLNIQRIAAIRNIDRPFSFLRKNGFTHNTATMLAQNKIKVINLAHIEKLCLVFSCLPSDLFEWKPSQPAEQLKGIPLAQIIRTQQPIDFKALLSNMPMDKLKEIEEEIRKRKQ